MTSYTYTPEMEARLTEVASSGLTEAKIESLMTEFDFPRRSVTAKLRKMGFDVPTKPKEALKFSDEETNELREYLEANSGAYTAEEIAAHFADSWGRDVNARQINGKALSLEMTQHIKPAEKKVTPKTYSEQDEKKIASLVAKGAYLEDIASALDRSVQSVRGKLLSMNLKAPQKTKKETKSDPYDGIESQLHLTVDEIVAWFAERGMEKTARGVKTALTRRKLACADYPKAKSE